MTSEDRNHARFDGRLSAIDLGGDEAYGRLVTAAALLGKSPEDVAFEAACNELAERAEMSKQDAAIALRALDRAHAGRADT